MFREEFTSSFAVCHAGPLSKSKSEVFFLEGGKQDVPGEKSMQKSQPTYSTKLGSHCWETSALTTIYGVDTLFEVNSGSE